MTQQELLSQRRQALLEVVRSSYQKASEQSLGFTTRILSDLTPDDIPEIGSDPFSVTSSTVQYSGYPGVALLGFYLDMAGEPEDRTILSFETGLGRLRSRPETMAENFMADDVAVLGVACGLARLKGNSRPGADQHASWLLDLIDKTPVSKLWTSRLRSLAVELLEQRGLLRVPPDLQDVDETALELALSNVWPNAFTSATWLDAETQAKLLKHLLIDRLPQSGELERSVIWLKSLDVIINNTCQMFIPTISDTVRIIGRIQHALKRWVWRENALRKDVAPSRWLIDNEYDVQALLWTTLYPIYGPDLVDETFLESWGLKQPRVDLGIKRLKLIIEVKFARRLSDFKDFEEQVAGDLGLYFKNTDQFDHMVVVVYDDCDTPPTEQYESLRNALKQRERIEEVVFIRRPSMIPHRQQRI